jgi:hypothetical protein
VVTGVISWNTVISVHVIDHVTPGLFDHLTHKPCQTMYSTGSTISSHSRSLKIWNTLVKNANAYAQYKEAQY